MTTYYTSHSSATSEGSDANGFLRLAVIEPPIIASVAGAGTNQEDGSVVVTRKGRRETTLQFQNRVRKLRESGVTVIIESGESEASMPTAQSGGSVEAPCYKCNGNGRIKCPKCNGTALVPCNCSATSGVNCSDCKGRKMRACFYYDCLGGTVKCTNIWCNSRK